MCQSMVNIQSPTAEIRRGKKEERKKKKQHENIMVCPITLGDHKKDGQKTTDRNYIERTTPTSTNILQYITSQAVVRQDYYTA